MIVKGKKRPRVPRDLVGMYCEIEWRDYSNARDRFWLRRRAARFFRKYKKRNNLKLYRVTVWRKR